MFSFHLFLELKFFFAYYLQSPQVPGRISGTCDCWLADNDDAYFAITLHFIQEMARNHYELRSELGAFVHLPFSHSGERLGQTLYRSFMRVQAEKKVSLFVFAIELILNSLLFLDWLDYVR